MYPDDTSLSASGLTMSDAALLRARGAEACAFCGVMPIDPRAPDAAKFEWLARHHPVQESAALPGPNTAAPDDRTLRSTLARAVWDAQLEPAVGIPEAVLPVVVAAMSDDLRAFAEDQFVFAICGRCRNEADAHALDSEAILERYVRAAFDGNRTAAELQSTWRLASELASLIAAQAQLLQVAG